MDKNVAVAGPVTVPPTDHTLWLLGQENIPLAKGRMTSATVLQSHPYKTAQEA